MSDQLDNRHPPGWRSTKWKLVNELLRSAGHIGPDGPGLDNLDEYIKTAYRRLGSHYQVAYLINKDAGLEGVDCVSHEAARRWHGWAISDPAGGTA